MTEVMEPQELLSSTERLRLDYQQTTDLVRQLNDIRFKLLALVPTLSGTAVALVGRSGSPVHLIAFGALGLTANLGVLLYDLRNSQVYDYVLARASELERALGLGGPFAGRPTRSLRLLGLAAVDRERGLSLVYAAAIAGWTYLVAWGVLLELDVGNARAISAAVGAGAGVLLVVDLARLRNRAL